MKQFAAKTILFVVLLGGSYAWVNQYADWSPHLYDQAYKLKRMEKGESFETIILGDSRSLAMDRDGVPGWYNYGTTNFNGMAPYVYLLQRYLKFNRSPKVIVFSIIPETFCQNRPYELGPSTSRLYTLQALWKDPYLRSDLKRFAEMIRWRYDIHQFYRSPWKRNLFNKETGFLLFNRNFTYRRETLLLGVDGFFISSESQRYFAEFMGIAKQNHIKVLMYFMPVAKVGYVNEKGFYPGFQAQFPKFASRYPNLKVVPPYRSEDLYPDDYTVDMTHLNAKGAEYFNRTRFPQIVQMASEWAKTNVTN